MSDHQPGDDLLIEILAILDGAVNEFNHAYKTNSFSAMASMAPVIRDLMALVRKMEGVK